ncbi:MAG: hypothetical protein FJW66_06760 [Actinobacteria bacterium]|nr:hypothetical protein [Actinomycetota bacterium]
MDFDNITLAGVPDFDSMFQIPDFHSSERACHALYSLISWVSNRKGSRVFIQTFNTSNFVLESFVNSSYDDFYRQELENRRELFYPPFSNIINIIVSGRDPEAAREDIYRLHCEISKIGSVEFFLLGPSPAPYYKINLFYRWHIIIKTSDIMRFNVRLFKIIRNFKKNEGSKIITDVDPVWIL